MQRLFVIDDDSQSLESTARILEANGAQVIRFLNAREALDAILLQTHLPDLIVSDVRMPGMSGIEFFKALQFHGKRIPIVLMTAFGQVDEAVWAMKMGAVDFLIKPFKKDSLLECLSRASRTAAARQETMAPHDGELDFVGNSEPMKKLREVIRQVASTDVSVLILGESGSGKELVAKQIHLKSERLKGKFVALNVAAIPEDLLESELFGYEKGAFSGASHKKSGLFEEANQGTLFMDEIGDMPIKLQSKLLRVLQEGETRRLGATESTLVNARILSATHCDLDMLAAQGGFRRDLLFRLDVVRIMVPSLRERPEDIVEMIHYFISQFAVKHSRKIQELSPQALDAMIRYPWPGNVRELANVIERAVVLCKEDGIGVDDLPLHLLSERGSPEPIVIPIGTSLEAVEDLMIKRTLELTHGDKQLTAKLLGVNSRTIYRRLERDPNRS